MPVILPSTLPTLADLSNAGLDVISSAASTAPCLRVAFLNLMPGKKATERQFVQFLTDSPRLIELTLLKADTPEAAELDHEDGQDVDHLAHYHPMTAVHGETFDALIITGAPVGKKNFEDVRYWPELCRTYDWARDNVGTTLNICWAAAAALKHFHGVTRTLETEKLFGVYPQTILSPHDPLADGMGTSFPVPVSRYSIVRPELVRAVTAFEIVAAHPKTGIGGARDIANRQFLAFNHLEYSRGTLQREYERDVATGVSSLLPYNYFPENNPQRRPLMTWNTARRIFAANWVEEAARIAGIAPLASSGDATTCYGSHSLGHQRFCLAV